MKRKLFYTLFIGVVVGLIEITNVNALTPTKEWCFSFEEETGTITGYMPKNYSWKHCSYDVVIPETIKGVTVKKIGNKAFMNDYIESVVIPDTVTTIGNMAFASNDLTEVVIPDTVTKIGYGAFNDNSLEGSNYKYLYARTDINSDGIAEIDKTKLVGLSVPQSSYLDISIPSNVKTIGYKAFYGLNLNFLKLNEGLTTIENKAFYGSYIEKISVSSTLENADFSVDSAQVPYSDIVYYKWYTLDETGAVEKEYTFEPGVSTIIYGVAYEVPELYYYDISSVNFNKIRIDYEYSTFSYGNIDSVKVQIYKYNNSVKKYEYLTYTTNEYGVNLSSKLVAGQTAYYKIRVALTTPDGKTHYSDFSDVLTVKPIPTTPTGVKATKYKSGVAKITWNKVSGVDGYTLYKYNSKTGKYFAVINTKSNSITNSYGLKKGSSAYYRVKAYKIVNGKKVYSNFSASTFVRV